ncbi:MAG: FeoA domain-containing protein, partial [Oscillospiraceae bacterium]
MFPHLIRGNAAPLPVPGGTSPRKEQTDMVETLALDRLPEGRSAYVTEVHNEPSMRQRLADIGLIRGTR